MFNLHTISVINVVYGISGYTGISSRKEEDSTTYFKMVPTINVQSPGIHFDTENLIAICMTPFAGLVDKDIDVVLKNHTPVYI